VNLRILRNVSFASGSLIIGILGLALFGSLLLLPLFLQNLLGYDATRAGLTLMPRSLTMVFMMPVAGLLYNRLGAAVMLPFALVLAGASSLMMARFNLSTPELQILAPQVLQGIGFAFMFVPLSTATLSAIPRPQMQSAAGLYNLIRQLGGSLGTAIVVTVLDHRIQTASTYLARYASSYNPTFMHWWQTFQAGFVARGADPVTAHWRALATLQTLINQQSQVVAYDYVFAVIGIVLFSCIPIALLLRGVRRPQAGVEAAAAD
jgi:DHA2 family multidrug resistance protein